MSSFARTRSGTTGRRLVSPGDSLIRVALPPGTPREAQVAVNRLVELTADLARRCAQLQRALDSRIVIEQAKGVLAERLAVHPEAAFGLLRRAARANRLKLHVLAERVVASRTMPPELEQLLSTGARQNGRPPRS